MNSDEMIVKPVMWYRRPKLWSEILFFNFMRVKINDHKNLI